MALQPAGEEPFTATAVTKSQSQYINYFIIDNCQIIISTKICIMLKNETTDKTNMKR